MTTRSRAKAAAIIVVSAIALSACSDSLTDLERAQAQVSAKEKAVSEAEAAFTSASDQFCSAAEDYILAVDVYGDVIAQSEPTVGDVQNAGADLTAPRDEALSSAQAAVDAQAALVTAQQELIVAQNALAVAEAGPSGEPTLVQTPEPSATALAPAATVDRVTLAESDFASTSEGIDASTPLSEASEQFHAAAVALELSWIWLFVDTGCATEDQARLVSETAKAYTKTLQKALKDAEYYTGEVDGIYGPLTTEAVEELQAANDLPVTGTVDMATANALQADLVELGFTEAQEMLAATAAVQQTLKLLGLWDGPVDGVWTEELTAAVMEAQEALGVEPTGEVDAATVQAFQKALAELKDLITETGTPSASPEPTASS
jgi:hypothetical protein